MASSWKEIAGPLRVTLADVSEATSGASTAEMTLPHSPGGYHFGSEITAGSAGTLDVVVEAQIIDGTWSEVAAFTQASGTGKAILSCNRSQAQAEFVAGASLTAGTARHAFGTKYRVTYTISGGTWSFNVTAVPY